MRQSRRAGNSGRAWVIVAAALSVVSVSAFADDSARPAPVAIVGSAVDVVDVTAVDGPVNFADPVIEEVMRPLYNSGAAGSVDAQQSCGAFGGASIPAALAMFAALSWMNPRRRR
ncbi:MAG: hypothetical protein FLDDKLPJ_00861 [Phycisphaerae bacterium]|nr:hypothetical protein [Phycisphaerae bacterium]